MTSRKLPVIAAALAMLAFTSVLFFPALFGGKILAPLDITTTLLQPWAQNAEGAKPHNHNPSDAVTQYLPYRMFAEKSLREDGYIGWNPYEMGGYNQAANTMALPGSWPMQLHRFLPFKDAWNLGIIAEFLIAGSGMLVFLRSRSLPWIPCLIGAVAFTFNAQFIIWIYHRWALGSFCWMPWVLWSFGNGFSHKPLERRILLLPGFLALALLGGSLQHVAFVVLACACIAAGSFDFRRPLGNTPALIGWGAAFLLALGIAAFSLGPQISGYLSNIAIGHTRGGIGYEGGLTQPLLHALLIPARIWPWLAGDPQTIDGWRLLKSSFMELNYLGTIPMLLGFIGLFRKDMPAAAKWLIVVGLLIPLTPLVGPLYHRVELLFILGAAWMSAEMLAHLPMAIKTPRWPRWIAAGSAALGVLLLMGTCLPSGIRTNLENQIVSKALAKSSDSPFGDDKEWISSRALEWTTRFSILHPRTAWVYGLLVVGAAGLVLSIRRQPASVRSGQLLILCATSLELATLFQNWTTFADPKDLHPSDPAIETVRSLAGPHRVLQSPPDVGIADIFAAPNILASFGIPSLDAYESIQYRSSLIALKETSASMRLSLAGVGLAIQPNGVPPQPGTEDWPIESSLGKYTFRKNPNVPAPISAGTSSLPTSPAEILASLDSSTAITPSNLTLNHATIVAPDGASWLRISQNWHPGWKWRVAGSDWQPFLDGPDAACWIGELPRESRNIEFSFFPRPHWITLVSFGAALVWLCLIAALAISARFGRLPLPAAR